jgi:predicted nicotinamide N-methyase
MAPTRAPKMTFGDRLDLWRGEREMHAIGPWRTDQVPLPGTDQMLTITRPYPAVPDPEDYPDHWVEFWPAGVVMAGAIAREPWRLEGKRVLEVGPGAGVTAVAAQLAGPELTVVDYSAGSLALTARNVREQTGIMPATAFLNWRHPPASFWDRAGDGFDIVIGADMLYEMKDAKPLSRFLERVVATDGEVWITHAEREAAERLVAILRERGWQGPTEECLGPVPDPQEETFDIIKLHQLRRPARTR